MQKRKITTLKTHKKDTLLHKAGFIVGIILMVASFNLLALNSDPLAPSQQSQNTINILR